ncbi:MAG: solute carrier family 23 protein [Oscillochloridaceae bacterium]|nr:SulP family inorganic anion transporter [Chloroflexaceae bacterium]MDW8391029.1 solute carrier family 23 protein [Oscillochloridaceae bacterium]
MSHVTRATPRRLAPPRFLQAVRGVSAGSLSREILAGVTLAALMIPLNIGYAQVAGLPPIVGLHAAILPAIVWALTCHTRHVVASPDAAIAAMIIALVSPFAAPDEPRYAQLVFAQALICGLIFVAFWAFRLGFLANFLSHAVLVGFITGLGVEVLFSQIRKIMGVSVEAEGFFREAWATLLAIPEASLWSVVIGVGTIIVIRALQRVAPKLPGALIGLVLATILVSVLGLDQRGVSVLGAVPSGLSTFALPNVKWADYLALFPGALALAAVTLAEAPLIARRYAEKYGEPLDVDQDLFAFGAANAAAGLFGGFSVGSSASRTAAMDSVGARTQIPSLVAGVVVAVILLFFTDLLALLPNAALAGIVANAVVKLIEVDEFRELRRVRRSEFWVAAFACVAVLVLGALQGVIIAFVLSLIDLIWRASQPHTAVLVEQPDGQSFEAPEGAPVQTTRPGLIIYRFSAPLYFANAGRFQDEVKSLAANAAPPVRWFVLDAAAISDIDTTGARALAQTITALKAQGITFAISRARTPVPDLLERYELLEQIGKERLFVTNRAAVRAFEQVAGAQ